MPTDSEPRPLKELMLIEWSATRFGIPLYGGLRGYNYACCPVCNGVQPYDRVTDCWPLDRIGHREDCPLRIEIMRALEVEKKRMLDTACSMPASNRYSFAVVPIRKWQRDGKYLSQLHIEAEGERIDVGLTRAEIKELHRVTGEFLKLYDIE